MTALRPTWDCASVTTGATISSCGLYRYDLTRQYDPTGPWCLFIGLNPSTADAKIDDPTIRHEIDFAHGFGYPNLAKCNLYALRSTDPKGIVTTKVDPIGGDDNREAIQQWVHRASLILFAWGYSADVGKRMLVRAWEVRRDIRVFLTVMKAGLPWPDFGHLGLTKGKERQPRHPLYLPKDTPWTRIEP